MEPSYQRIDHFVASTRQAIFVRDADGVLMIRPDKTLAINESGAAILGALYRRNAPGAEEVLRQLAGQLKVGHERLLKDTSELVEAVGALLNEDFSPRAKLRFASLEGQVVSYPTLAEIALTYGCQNRCAFCYAASPYREKQQRLMSTQEVQRVMETIFHEGHVPSLSFTGGEATLRPDLPELIHYGERLGFRVNLISNGVKLADRQYTASLAEAGLASAQISLEAGEAELHDRIVGRTGAFEKTCQGVHNLRLLGLHVHTNTTLCGANLDQAHQLIRYVGRELQLKTLSMNMVIRTGVALGNDSIDVSYTEVGSRLPSLLETAREEGVKLVWYSPIPYCIFNPALHGLGAKSCACVHGILSVDPSGQLLPCSSFREGLGSLLEHSYKTIYHSRAARYWRKRRYIPPACTDCPDIDLCAGACPLYWDEAGSFNELPRPGAESQRQRAKWERKRRGGRSFGVPAPQLEKGID